MSAHSLIQIKSHLDTFHKDGMMTIICKELFSLGAQQCAFDWSGPMRKGTVVDMAEWKAATDAAARQYDVLPGVSRKVGRTARTGGNRLTVGATPGACFNAQQRGTGMSELHSAEVVSLAAWRSGGLSRAPLALDEFGPPLLPVRGAQDFAQNHFLGLSLDGDCQFCGARPVGIGDVLEVPQRGIAAVCECLTLGFTRKCLEEGQQRGHDSITPSGVHGSQHRSVSPRVSTQGMSDEAAIRRENFKRLVQNRAWEVKALASVLGYGRYSYWNDLLNDASKPFGEKAARKIEEKAGLTRGWLDSTDDVPAVKQDDRAAELSPLQLDHQMVFGLLSEADQQEIHALACAIVMEKNPKLVALMTQAGVSKRADDSKVAAWKAQIDSGKFAIPNQNPPREGLLNKPGAKRKHA